MNRIGLILIINATCQAMLPVIGNLDAYSEITLHDKLCAESFIMPEDGTIQTISIYHEGGRGEMLLGVYLGDGAPDLLLSMTSPTQVSAYAGWQTAALTKPMWIPGGTLIWLAWIFEDNPGIRYQSLSGG
ncbi:MAG: hypothetical protein JXM79_02430, partial [Sedimentisphaerales bacterium]|nr:hypothetical protein [Sedimentisphaerales bacterium]